MHQPRTSFHMNLHLQVQFWGGENRSKIGRYDQRHCKGWKEVNQWAGIIGIHTARDPRPLVQSVSHQHKYQYTILWVFFLHPQKRLSQYQYWSSSQRLPHTPAFLFRPNDIDRPLPAVLNDLNNLSALSFITRDVAYPVRTIIITITKLIALEDRTTF